MKEIRHGESVSLYKRIFLGIDKQCDEESSIPREKQEDVESTQESELVLLYIEIGYITFIFGISTIGMLLHTCCHFDIGDCYINTMGISSFINGIIIFISMIVRSVFLSKLNSNKIYDYECSDSITNEFIKNENDNTKSFIRYIAINLGVDVVFIGFNGIAFIIALRDYLENRRVHNYDLFRSIK